LYIWRMSASNWSFTCCLVSYLHNVLHNEFWCCGTISIKLSTGLAI